MVYSVKVKKVKNYANNKTTNSRIAYAPKSGAMEQLGKGNTNPPIAPSSKKKREVQSKVWCWTLNNYDLKKVEQLEQWIQGLNMFCEKWVFGFEIGESGTPHLQGYMVLFEKRRLSEIKKLDDFFYKMHLENRKGTEEEAIRYCVKDGNYRHSENLPQHFFRPKIVRKMKILSPADYYPWQRRLEAVITSSEVDERSIYWIFEETGNTGKSAFTKSICFHYAGTLLINKGKRDDIMNAAFNVEGALNTVIMDIPRTNGNSVSYDTLESLKNGVIINNKYETGQKLIASPVIIVLANMMPVVFGLSLDRWKIFKIVDKDLEKVELTGDNFDTMSCDSIDGVVGYYSNIDSIM